MSNKYRRIGQDAWVEIPEHLKATWDGRSRTHHPIDNLESGWWKEGEVKELDKDFIIVGDDDGGRMIEPKKIIIQIKPQPTTERRFTLDEMGDCWDDAAISTYKFENGRDSISKEEYFKKKFGIDL